MRNRYVHRVRVVWPCGCITFRHYQSADAADRYATAATSSRPRWEPVAHHRGVRATETSTTRSEPVTFPGDQP